MCDFNTSRLLYSMLFQAVIASALGNLGAALKDTSYFDQAEITLDAAISQLTTNGILKESCDDATSAATQCDHDQVLLFVFPSAGY
jgi:hypothetical protein